MSINNEEKIDGIIATNTSLDRLGLEKEKLEQTGLLLSEENGGLSGRPLQKKQIKSLSIFIILIKKLF